MRVKTMPLGILDANAHLLWDPQSKEAMIADCGGDVHKVMAVLEEKGLTLKYIALTHGHCDHIAGVVGLKAQTNAQILIHELDGEMVEDPAKNLSSKFPITPITFKADQLLKDGEVFMLGEEKVTVHHTPGHTRGGVCFEAGEYLVTGDTLFQGSIGRTDLYGGNANVLEKSLAKLAKMSNQLIILPGHGPQSTLRDEKRNNPYLSRHAR